MSCYSNLIPQIIADRTAMPFVISNPNSLRHDIIAFSSKRHATRDSFDVCFVLMIPGSVTAPDDRASHPDPRLARTERLQQ
ncbi:MAG: hypothetical protein ACI87E_001547 [Mariniblastus sp.]|jgi:hypothetical protein